MRDKLPKTILASAKTMNLKTIGVIVTVNLLFPYIHEPSALKFEKRQKQPQWVALPAQYRAFPSEIIFSLYAGSAVYYC